MAKGIIELKSSTWEADVLNSKGLIMVDFWAPWCGPCRIIAPTIEEIAKEYTGKIKVGKLNTDENPDIATRYGIMGIPTIMFFKDGKRVGEIVGIVSKSILKTKLDSLIDSL